MTTADDVDGARAVREALEEWRRWERQNQMFRLGLEVLPELEVRPPDFDAAAVAVLGPEDHAYGYRIDRSGTMGGRAPALITRVCLTHRDCPREQRVAALDVAFDAGAVWQPEMEPE